MYGTGIGMGQWAKSLAWHREKRIWWIWWGYIAL